MVGGGEIWLMLESNRVYNSTIGWYTGTSNNSYQCTNPSLGIHLSRENNILCTCFGALTGLKCCILAKIIVCYWYHQVKICFHHDKIISFAMKLFSIWFMWTRMSHPCSYFAFDSAQLNPDE